ncbi:hypothetical protein RRG08_019879 [Elysia crispata]|uniref:Uncharacterized protein n=1 Tax=Elysia crispata TaxID=231223 RepID=A0AAE0Z8E5_9GAST|nr:hypothetical protein RRG08_019879 [Elysia crispata]
MECFVIEYGCISKSAARRLSPSVAGAAVSKATALETYDVLMDPRLTAYGGNIGRMQGSDWPDAFCIISLNPEIPCPRPAAHSDHMTPYDKKKSPDIERSSQNRTLIAGAKRSWVKGPAGTHFVARCILHL